MASNDNSAVQSPDGGLNSPELSNSLKPKARAIKDEKQLETLIKQMEQDNRDRNQKNGRIMAKYNAEKPFKTGELQNDGLLWKSNFSTQPLAALIDRIAPRFVRALDAARYLTSAKLPDHVPNAAQKTEIFQREFTNLVREREGARDFWSEVAQENALFGYTATGYTDEYSWFPRHFRQDEFFVPAGTKQNAGRTVMIVFRETMLVHELYDIISDPEAAKTAGWDIEKAVEAINKAMPDDVRKSLSQSARKYEDMSREANVYASLAHGAKVVILYNVFVSEVTGKVSHYIMDGRDWKQLFEREDRFNSMSEVATFFSFQQANGNLQASKGVGRTVYTLAGVIDRSRNEVIDRLQLSGKIVVQGDPKDVKAFKMSVVGNAIVISKNFTINAGKIDAGVEPFIQLDQWVMNLMDELGGNVSPASASGQMQGERVTNGQINYLADLQAEAKDVKIERFLGCAANLLTQMQRRAAAKNVEDEDAKEFQAKCLKYMTREEFDAIAAKPAAKTVEDWTQQEREAVILTTTESLNNPLVNQKEALRRKFTAAVDAEFADALLLPDEDPTVTAEQVRWQELENDALSRGKQIPVSPRDNDVVHLTQLGKFAEEVASAIGQDTNNVAAMQRIVEHMGAHIASAQKKGTPKEQIQPFAEMLGKLQQGIQTIAQAAQEHLTGGPAAANSV